MKANEVDALTLRKDNIARFCVILQQNVSKKQQLQGKLMNAQIGVMTP